MVAGKLRTRLSQAWPTNYDAVLVCGGNVVVVQAKQTEERREAETFPSEAIEARLLSALGSLKRTVGEGDEFVLARMGGGLERQMQERRDLLQRMAPEKRALFERIVGLRKKIGPVGINLAESIRELRENG